MLPNPSNYAVWPSIIPADKSSTLTVTATERAFLFVTGEVYTVTVISVDDDELEYKKPSTAHPIHITAEDGVLRFSYRFPEEGEHLLLLSHGEKRLGELSVYSLYEDLYGLLPLRGDFHSHSYRSDGKRDPAALAGHFREQGYDIFALTDHNRFYPGDEIDEVYASVHTALHRIFGEEVHAPGGVSHIIHVCGERSVCEDYIADTEGYLAEVKEKYLPLVPSEIPDAYRERYAITMWVTDRIHRAGGLAIFAHPYWRPAASRVHNVREELARIYLKSGLFDAYELVGGMGQDGVNCSVSLWSELRAEGYDIPVVGSSDVHSLKGSYSFPHFFTLVLAESTASEAVKQAILDRRSVAIEASGSEYSREYRAYGAHRLVLYAQYLLRHYFPRLERIAAGEGVAMRAYAIGEAEGALVSMLADQAEAFRDRFLGRRPPVLPSKEVLAFEEARRGVHLASGLTTKGSHVIDPDGKITVQI